MYQIWLWMVMIQAISRSGACCDWLVLPCDWPVLDGSGKPVIGYSFISKNNLNRQQFFSRSLYLLSLKFSPFLHLSHCFLFFSSFVSEYQYFSLLLYLSPVVNISLLLIFLSFCILFSFCIVLFFCTGIFEYFSV